MAALSQDTPAQERAPIEATYPVAAGARIYAGALLQVRDGFVKPATKAEGQQGCGVARERASGGPSDGDVTVVVARRLVVRRTVEGSAPSKGDTVYAEDDQTVHATAAGRSEAGVVVESTDDGAWVWVP